MQGDMDRVGRLFSAAAHRVAVERDSEEDRRHFLEWERGGHDSEAIRAISLSGSEEVMIPRRLGPFP